MYIKRIDVHWYLRAGTFYEGLCVDDEAEFGVPANCFKPDTSVKTEGELVSLLHTVRFWGLYEIPLDAFKFIVCGTRSVKRNQVLADLTEFKSFVQSALKVRYALSFNTIQTAIAQGFGVRAVRLLRAKGYVWTAGCCEAAVAVDDLECLKFLRSAGCPWNFSTTNMAVEKGNVQCLQYALSLNCPRHCTLTNSAALAGNIEMLKVLHVAGVEWNISTLLCAVASRNIACVRYLCEQGCTYSPRSCVDAAVRGDVECLQYFHGTHGLSLGGVATCAAAVGNRECLVYLREQNGPWDVSCCAAAARGNHLDCLTYAHRQGCPWDERTLVAAISARSWSCLWYALRQGCPRDILRLAIFVFLEVYALMFAAVFAPAAWMLLSLPGNILCTTPVTLFLVRAFGPHAGPIKGSIIALFFFPTILWIYFVASLPHIAFNFCDGRVSLESV